MSRKVKSLRVYAYGILPLYGGANNSHFVNLGNGQSILFEPYAFHHYWVDEKFQYGEEILKESKAPKLEFVAKDYEVELTGHMIIQSRQGAEYGQRTLERVNGRR